MPLIDDIFDESFIDDEIMEYINFMDEEENDKTGFLKRKDIDEHFEEIGNFLNYFIWYPDYFIDLMVPSTSHFSLFPFQRIMLRGMLRSKACFETFSRGTSKSFLADIALYLLCMFYPNFHCSITAGTNKQGAEIAKQKVVGDLWQKFPLLANEMQKRRVAGKLLDPYHMQKDYVEFAFTNGSSLQIGAVRGLRFEALIFEEVIEQDETQINEVFIPTLNRPRAMSNGLINNDEVQGRQIYITTAGYQGTFAYNKLIDILCNEVLDPDLYCIFTGTYKIPLYHGLTAKKQIEDVIASPAFSKSSFEREYESRWSDAPAGAAFSANVVSSLRQVKMVELKDKLTDAQKEQDCFYVICADMAKDGGAETAVGVAKVIPKEHYFTYKFVNLFTIPSTDYMVIANTFKKTVLAYNAKLLIYDANGVGAGIRDWLNKETTDEFGYPLEGLGIINPPSSTEHDVIRYPKDKTICYEIKSGGKVGEQIHWFFFSRMSTGAITYPIKCNDAINLYTRNKTFVQMAKRKQLEFLAPFKTMDKMEEELRNLDLVNTSDNMSNTLKIVRRNQAIQKDFFSMAEYLVWAVNQYFELDYYKRRRSKTKTRMVAMFD